jgi:phosphoserine phosphatase RsbU/P
VVGEEPAHESLATALGLLLRGAHQVGTADLPVLVDRAASAVGARSATVYVVEYDLSWLIPFKGSAPAMEPLPIGGSVAGKAFAEGIPISAADNVARTWWLPLLNGMDRVGVLELRLAEDDERAAEHFSDLASLVAQLIVTRSAVGDAVEMSRRLAPMRLEAEMQWKLLPPLSFATPRTSIAGSLVPAHEVAGDSFDYALNGSVLHVALFDAMGHGLSAALLASLTLSAYRSARRTGLDLSDVVRSIDKHVSAQFPDSFVTAIIGQLDVATGTFTWASCGHHPALLVRGGRVVKTLDGGQNLPLGLQSTADVAQALESLEPEDRLLLYSDGVIEARDVDGEWFGTDRLVDEVTKASAAGLPAAETMRRLVHGILDHQNGDLQDDATTLLVEWPGNVPSGPDAG